MPSATADPGAADPGAADPGAVPVRGWLEAHRGQLEAELAELVAIGSHAAEPEGIAAVAARIAAWLEPLGFRFEVHPQVPLPPEDGWLGELLSPGVPYERLGATWTGRRGPSEGGRGVLVLLGDLDTAFPAGEGPGPVAERRDGRLYGPGAADMKGGLVVIAAALRALVAAGLPVPQVRVVLAGDEQAGSLGSRPWIERALEGADWCLCAECARDGGKVMASRGHIGVGWLIAQGREAHTGSAHAAGVNAIDALVRVLVGVPRLTDPARGIYVTATLVAGGRRRSVMPAFARATIDVRTPDAGAWRRTARRLERLVKRANARGDAVGLRLRDHRPGVPWDAGAARLLALAAEAGRELGLEIEAIRSPAAGSSAFAGPLGVPTLDGLGPLGGGIMTADEHIELDSLVPRAALLALLISRLASSPAPAVSPNSGSPRRPRPGVTLRSS